MSLQGHKNNASKCRSGYLLLYHWPVWTVQEFGFRAQNTTWISVLVGSFLVFVNPITFYYSSLTLVTALSSSCLNQLSG